MRMSLGLYAWVFFLHILSALVFVAMWRWLVGVAPRFMARFRRPLLALFIVVACLPLCREIGFFFPDTSLFVVTGAVGMLCHFVVWFSMASVLLIRGLRRVAARFTRSRGVDRPENPDRRVAIERIGGAATFAFSGAVLGWGAVRGRFDWSVEEVPIKLARLPKALDGFTIVQLSDLHIGSFVGERELAAGLSLLDGVRADLIVITGDIIDAETRYVPLAARRLGALRAREGVICIPGNHDHYAGAGPVLEGMRRAGVDVLLNRGKVIAEGDGGFALLGVDDIWAARRGGVGPDLKAALSTVPPDLATVLLAHQPRYAETAAKAGIDLQLSGHTHGGQINPGFRPIDWFFRYVAGRYDVGATQLYVNRGFGTVGPPSRVGAPPEITKIVLVAG